MEIFNNREIAYLMWLPIIAVYFLRHREMRTSAGKVLACFIQKPVIISLMLLFLHTLSSVWVLSAIGIWNLGQIKNTILWFIGVAIVSLFNFDKIEKDPNYFKNSAVSHFRVIIFLEFLVNVYTFSILIEFIFAFFMGILGVLIAISKTSKEYAVVEKILTKLLEVIGTIIILCVVYNLAIDFEKFAQIGTFYDFVVPIALSLLLLPFIYLFYVWASYEKAFLRLKTLIKDENLCNYAKKSAIIKYNFNLRALNRWAHPLILNELVTKNDVDKSHEEIARLEAEEKNPPIVPFALGWSPYRISSILGEKKLNAGHYKKCENMWFAQSEEIEIGKSMLPNSISYCIEGNREAATLLKLKMTIYGVGHTDQSEQAEQSMQAHNIFCKVASVLYFSALGQELDQKFQEAIMKGTNREATVNTKMVRVTKECFSSFDEVIFSISND